MRPDSRRLLAKEKGLDRYVGTLCKNGHDGTRFTVNGRCVECTKVWSKEANATDYHKRWRDKNRTRVRETQFTYNLMWKYGLSRKEYDSMHEAQNHVCKICKRPQVGGQTLDRLVVDHCHETGKVRGLLCVNCNSGIGNFSDEITRLKSAIIYLENAE